MEKSSINFHGFSSRMWIYREKHKSIVKSRRKLRHLATYKAVGRKKGILNTDEMFPIKFQLVVTIIVYA